MQHHIAFVHTSPVHVDTFDRLVKSLDSTLHARHLVAEDLLTEAQRAGTNEPALVKRVQHAMRDAASTGAAVVVCTCSTIGGIAERTPTDGSFVAARIDRAMADRAVELGPRILIVAALESTLGPTTDLIQESAHALQTDVSIQTLLLPGAWPHFLRGDHKAYLQEVVAAVAAAAATNVDVIVLAQASMAAAAAALSGLAVEVLASPLLGVQRAIADLKR